MAPCQSIKALTTITLRLKGRNDKTICILAMQIAFLMVMKGSVLWLPPEVMVQVRPQKGPPGQRRSED